MNNIRISDITLKQKAAELLTFREKIELVKLLDRLQADVIELAPIKNTKADSLFIKSVVNTVNECCVSVQTGPDKEAIEAAWDALKTAKHPRIQICAPVSLVQMEYIYHWAPEKMVEAVIDSVSLAKELCADVEFLAEDATRADKGFLYEIIEAAAEAGATAITICDSAGTLLPGEFAGLTSDILENANTSAASGVILGICADNSLAMADACSIAAACAGAREVKAAIYPDGSASIENIVNIIKQRGNDIRLSCSVRNVEISRIADQAARMFTQEKSKTSPFENGVQSANEGRFYTADDDISAIVKETEALGYDLSEEDKIKVYDRFCNIASKKEKVYVRELDAIVASSAMQVPPTYKIEDYIINSGNVISATAHLRLFKGDELRESVVIGDGPVDAAFLAIEQIVGTHYELDDFQIRSVTEGREAMGEAVVKLRADGKLYSGRGLSTDIIGASIHAYINALNKIAYDEEDNE
ncbi:MAG: hypothetical protein IJM39_01850 [Firmicutes bacterium]|nr:hypothetical protein [Bacillota bacterium]